MALWCSNIAVPPVWGEEEREKAAISAKLHHSEDQSRAASPLEQWVAERRITSAARDSNQWKKPAHLSLALRPHALTAITERTGKLRNEKKKNRN